jgi:hypothetical protein
VEQQTVTIACVTCHRTWPRSLRDIGDEETLSEVAKEFLAAHATCGIGIGLTSDVAGGAWPDSRRQGPVSGSETVVGARCQAVPALTGSVSPER